MSKNLQRSVFVITILLLLCLIFHSRYVNEFPSHIHAWAQSDRYALSLGFLDNGLNFFKPQTFVYNHQFPGNWNVASEETITAVDFPIHDYIPALIMKLLGNTSPWVFRMYVLLYSIMGLFFLFKLSYSITKDYIKSVFVVVFAATSPVYAYYQGGFLPTIPSLSNAIIGIYYYYQFLKENKSKNFWLCMLFLSFATLSRTTFAIPIVAVLSVEFIRIMRKETSFVLEIKPVSFSVILVLSYLLYNRYLRNYYGSIFLNHLLPAENMEQAKAILKYVYQNCFFQYFSIFHYIFLIILFIYSAFFIFKRKSCFKKVEIYFGLTIGSYLIGCIIFLFFMLRQFYAHDYYFIDTFYLPINLLLIMLFALIPKISIKGKHVVEFVLCCMFLLIFIIQPIKSQKQRRETGPWDKTEITINNFRNSAHFLDLLGISESSKILVLDAVAPNIPFLLMQRKGYAVMDTKKENLERALSWNFDHVVFQNEYFISDIYTPYPGIVSKLKKVADNGKISICKMSNNENRSLLDFMGLNKETPIFRSSVDFEATCVDFWQNYEPTAENVYSGMFSGKLTPDITYGLTYKTSLFYELQEKPRTLLFSAYFLKLADVNCEIVVSIHEGGKNVYYKSNNLQQIIKNEDSWEKVTLIYQLPKIESDSYEFAVFLYNVGKSTLYYDEFCISVY